MKHTLLPHRSGSYIPFSWHPEESKACYHLFNRRNMVIFLIIVPPPFVTFQTKTVSRPKTEIIYSADMVCYFGNEASHKHFKLTRFPLLSFTYGFAKLHKWMACVHTWRRAHAPKEFNLETIIGAQRRTRKSYCYNAQIINHSDILLALSLYIPLKWCLAQIVRGQTLNRPGLKCRSQTPSSLLLELHRTRRPTLDVLSEEKQRQREAGLTSR